MSTPLIAIDHPLGVASTLPPRPTSARLAGYAQALGNRRRRLAHIAAIYQYQLSVYPLQVEATLRHLSDLRHIAERTYLYLKGLQPVEMEHIRPYGSITKLATLDHLLTELLLNAAMFAAVCQAICPERVLLHLTIRAAFPVLLTCYNDLLAMLDALAEKGAKVAGLAGTGMIGTN
jgi:hypothetical protein